MADTKYDDLFIQYFLVYFEATDQLDWRWIKAQGMAESRLRADALSFAGAKGIMQIMDATADDIAEQIGCAYSPFDPAISIKFGTWYDNWLWHRFTIGNPIEHRRFMFAAYNAGLGNIRKAIKRAKEDGLDHTRWEHVALVLHAITGNNAKQTIDYIHRIERNYLRLVGAH